MNSRETFGESSELLSSAPRLLTRERDRSKSKRKMQARQKPASGRPAGVLQPLPLNFNAEARRKAAAAARKSAAAAGSALAACGESKGAETGGLKRNETKSTAVAAAAGEEAERSGAARGKRAGGSKRGGKGKHGSGSGRGGGGGGSGVGSGGATREDSGGAERKAEAVERGKISAASPSSHPPGLLSSLLVEFVNEKAPWSAFYGDALGEGFGDALGEVDGGALEEYDGEFGEGGMRVTRE